MSQKIFSMMYALLLLSQAAQVSIIASNVFIIHIVSRGVSFPKIANIPKENILIMGEWNKMRIKVVGGRVMTWLNDQAMVNFTDEKIGQAFLVAFQKK